MTCKLPNFHTNQHFHRYHHHYFASYLNVSVSDFITDTPTNRTEHQNVTFSYLIDPSTNCIKLMRYPFEHFIFEITDISRCTFIS